MWRDPLCELIQELDRLVPPANETDNRLPTFGEVQRIVHTLLEGTEAQRKSLLSDAVYLSMRRSGAPTGPEATWTEDVRTWRAKRAPTEG
jgi:hypothetical protein